MCVCVCVYISSFYVCVQGIMAFFSGLRASMLGLSHIMIQFPLYERLKLDLAQVNYEQGLMCLSYA